MDLLITNHAKYYAGGQNKRPLVIEDKKIAKIAISQKVLYQSLNKKFRHLESSSATISRILSIFGGVDPDISGQKDSSGRLFLISCIFFLKGPLRKKIQEIKKNLPSYLFVPKSPNLRRQKCSKSGKSWPRMIPGDEFFFFKIDRVLFEISRFWRFFGPRLQYRPPA